MGHTRLGKISTARKWKEIVTIISDSIYSPASGVEKTFSEDDINNISGAIVSGASEGLELAKNDIGLVEVLYNYFVIVQEAKHGWKYVCDFLEKSPDEIQTIQEFTSEVQLKIDKYLLNHDASSDISEIALQSFGTALTKSLGKNTKNLFSEEDDIYTVLKKETSKEGVSNFGQLFFGEFTSRLLNFYLSRISSYSISTSQNFQVPELSKLNKDFYNHCFQTSRIVKDFSAEWFSKANYEDRIDRKNVNRFVAIALEKIRKELQIQERGE